LVEPAGIVITDRRERLPHRRIGAAAVPTLTIFRVSTPEPVSMLIESPAFMPVVP